MGHSLEDILPTIEGFLRRERSATVAIDADTPLIHTGLLDSFTMAQLAEEMSRVHGVDLKGGDLLPEDFESPRTLYLRLRHIQNWK